jgi:hypothetical protein
MRSVGLGADGAPQDSDDDASSCEGDVSPRGDENASRDRDVSQASSDAAPQSAGVIGDG